jgi:ectoine hydroxylase-related dioxygenase (phytanoyl-CoA dioxygenase family)
MNIAETERLAQNKSELLENGFTIIENIYAENEINTILQTINRTDSLKPTFRKTNDLFAIRQFLKEVPEVTSSIFTKKLNEIIRTFFGGAYFVVKSIYFDKPEDSNWFVSYHQDLTISVNQKVNIDGFGPWTVKQDQYAVQPPLKVLQDNFTVRIHLDDTNENNGALRVIQGSHLKGVYRPETIDWSKEKEIVCPVSKGGIMIMRPLLLHASSRTSNSKKRRVIHIEFSNQELPRPLQWSEFIGFSKATLEK